MSEAEEVDVPPSILRRSLDHPPSKSNSKELIYGSVEISKGHPHPPSTQSFHGTEEEDDDYDSDEDYKSFQTIDPLTTHAGDCELDTIRDSYRRNELVDSMDINTSSASPLPKRPSVFSGHEHEDSDDFAISTMLAIRTAVCA